LECELLSPSLHRAASVSSAVSSFLTCFELLSELFTLLSAQIHKIY